MAIASALQTGASFSLALAMPVCTAPSFSRNASVSRGRALFVIAFLATLSGVVPQYVTGNEIGHKERKALDMVPV